MITDIFMAAITGARRSLPFTAPVDGDINVFRALLSIDAAVPASYVPLIRAIGAFPYVTDGLMLPVPPSGAMPVPSITMGGSTVQPAWTSSKPPTFIHKPAQLPVPSVWTLTRINAATALLVNDAGYRAVVPCHLSQSGTVTPAWPAEVGSSMGVQDDGTWSTGTSVVFNIPSCAYPFAYADKMLATKPEIIRLLEDAGSDNLHASLLRPAERVAVVAAAVVKRFVRSLTSVSDGVSEKWYLDPRLIAWNNLGNIEVLELNNNIFSINV